VTHRPLKFQIARPWHRATHAPKARRIRPWAPALAHPRAGLAIRLDSRQRVNVINDEARRLLHITSHAVGVPLTELLPPGRLRDVLDGTIGGADQNVMTSDALLVVNRRPVSVAGRDVGSIVTLRDRTEIEVTIRRMNAVTGLSDALRAQEHEYTNRLHVISGLLDLDEIREARQYLQVIAQQSAVSAEDLRSRVSPPPLAALLVAKIAVAAEHGVTLTITADSHLEAPAFDPNLLMSVVGNLVDNAIDATAAQPDPRLVTVHLSDANGELRIQVTDNGPGVPTEALSDIFTDGYTTKPPRGDLHRGIGLALVERLVTRAGGAILVTPGPGGHFEVVLPGSVPSPPQAPTALFNGGGRE